MHRQSSESTQQRSMRLQEVTASQYLRLQRYVVQILRRQQDCLLCHSSELCSCAGHLPHCDGTTVLQLKVSNVWQSTLLPCSPVEQVSLPVNEL